MWLARPGVPGDPHLVDRQPLLGGAPVLLPQPDADLREVLQEEVGEVLVGEDDARLDAALHGLLPDRVERAEEVVALLLRRGLRADDIIGACEEQYARTISATGPSSLPCFPNGSRIFR